jgi:lipoprotein NlpD
LLRSSNDAKNVDLHVVSGVKSTQVKQPSKVVSRVENPPSTPLAVKTQAVKSNSLVWSWPVNGRLISLFNSDGGLSKGIDIAAKLGESVRAAADGEVVYSGSGLRGYGKLLIIKHQYSYLSAYAHNSRLLAKEGDVVKRGQVVAEVGASGIGINDVKLHFEIRRDGVPVNPVTILPR